MWEILSQQKTAAQRHAAGEWWNTSLELWLVTEALCPCVLEDRAPRRLEDVSWLLLPSSVAPGSFSVIFL